MNDSQLRKEVDIVIGNPLDRKRDTNAIMYLFTQALTARLDAVAGALPEKRILPSEHGDYPLKNESKDYCIGFNEAQAACHAAIDTVREGL